MGSELLAVPLSGSFCYFAPWLQFGHIWTAWGDSPWAFHFLQQQPLILALALPVPEIPEGKHRSAPRMLGSDPTGRGRSDWDVQHEEPEPCSSLWRQDSKSMPSAQILVKNSCWGAGIQWQHQGKSAGCLSRSLAVAAVTRSRQGVLQPLPCSTSISQGCTSRELGRKPGKLELYSWCCH